MKGVIVFAKKSVQQFQDEKGDEQGHFARNRGNASDQRSSEPVPRIEGSGARDSRRITSGGRTQGRATKPARGRGSDCAGTGNPTTGQPSAYPNYSERATPGGTGYPKSQSRSQEIDARIVDGKGTTDNPRHVATREAIAADIEPRDGYARIAKDSDSATGASDGISRSNLAAKHSRGLNPPAYFLVGLIAVVLLAAVFPDRILTGIGFFLVGALLILVGVGFNIMGSGQFERAGTPIRPGSSGGILVTDGIFRLSRNPMYLGMGLVLLGVAFLLGSAIALSVIPLFVKVIDRRFVVMEERILEEQFGEFYRTYCQEVRRWV